jgi:hypothetical protein
LIDDDGANEEGDERERHDCDEEIREVRRDAPSRSRISYERIDVLDERDEREQPCAKDDGRADDVRSTSLGGQHGFERPKTGWLATNKQ